MISTLAYMAPQGGSAEGSLLSTVLMFGLIIAIFYFMIYRPQRKRQAQIAEQKRENEEQARRQEEAQQRMTDEHERMKRELADLKAARDLSHPASHTPVWTAGTSGVAGNRFPAGTAAGASHLSQFRVLKEIGRGGMGTVYLAEDMMLSRKVALKMLHPALTTDTQFVERFRQEAKLQSSLIHSNIVALHTFFNEGGAYYMVMELAEGETLKHVIEQRGPLPERWAMGVFRQILQAVSHAHSKGIIHRDLKPGNIMVGRDGTVKVMDFGIAKILGDKGMTRTGAKIGTLYYMSPEQVQGVKDIDERTDIYSLGVTFYEMLTARLPFEGETDSEFEIMKEIIEREVPDPRAVYPGISQATVDIVRGMVAKARNERVTVQEIQLVL